MAITSRVTLKAAYEQGDKPQGSDYVNWLDSFLHLTDTSAQAVSSPITFNASASFQTLTATDIAVSGVNAALVSTGALHVSAASGGAYHIDTLAVSGSSDFRANSPISSIGTSSAFAITSKNLPVPAAHLDSKCTLICAIRFIIHLEVNHIPRLF